MSEEEEPEYVLPSAANVSLGGALAMLMTLQQILFVEDDGEINPDKEWNGDTLDAIGQMVSIAGLRPVKNTEVNDGQDLRGT